MHHYDQLLQVRVDAARDKATRPGLTPGSRRPACDRGHGQNWTDARALPGLDDDKVLARTVEGRALLARAYRYVG